MLPMFRGEPPIRQNIVLGVGQEADRLWKATLHHPRQFGSDRVLNRLPKDGAHAGGNHGLDVLRDVYQESARGTAAARPLEDLTKRGLDPRMHVAKDPLDPAEASGHEILQKCDPEGCHFTEADVKAQDLAVTRRGDTNCDHAGHAGDTVAVPHLEVFGIEPDIRVRTFQSALRGL